MDAFFAGVLLLLAALVGAPLFVIIGAAAMLLFAAEGMSSSVVIIDLNRILTAPAIVAIPLFAFSGFLLAESKAPQRLLRLARALAGSIPGGVGIAALMSCAVFTAFTGASGITIIAMGGILYPLLLHEKYPEDFSLGLVTTSGNLGLLFPPSLPIILYALVAGISLDQLFIAGIVPGMLVLAVLAAYSMYTAQSRKLPVTRFSWRELVRAAHGAAWEIPLPLLIVVGIYTGLFTATEAAAITAFYVFVVEVLVQKDVSLFKGVPQVMKDSMVLVGAILMVIAVAMGLTNFLVDQEVPARMFEFSRVYIGTPIAFLIALNLFLLLVGMMTDTFTAIIVAVPLVIPLARQYSVDPVHLGIVILTNLEIGELTPPIGINLFLSSIRFTKPFFTVVRATFPFICILLVALLAITYVPALSLWLVHLLHVR